MIEDRSLENMNTPHDKGVRAMELEAFLDATTKRLSAGDRPMMVTSSYGVHGLTYGSDEDGAYAVIGFVLRPRKGITLPNVYAEIEDGTYGELQGFRVYFEEHS